MFKNNKGIFWLSVWFVLNVGLTLLNKSLMVFYHFKFPILLSFIHQSVSTFFSFGGSLTKPSQSNEKNDPKFEGTVTRKILLISIIFTLNIVMGNVSLKLCSVAITQVVRAIIPLLTMLLSMFFLNAKYESIEFVACSVICLGVALSCFGESKQTGETRLTGVGLFVTFVACLLSSSKSVSIKATLSGEYKLSSDELLARISPISSIEMFILAVLYGENKDIVLSLKYKSSSVCLIGILISGLVAYFLNLTNFLATHHTSPLTVTIAGCVKQVTTIVLSVILFDKSITILNACGIVITTIGSLWYSLIGLKKGQKNETERKKEESMINLLDDVQVREERN